MQDFFQKLFTLRQEYLDCVRHEMSGMGAHPRQGPILGLLLSMDGASQADLVREMGVSAATVAVSLARLEKLGYVKRERNQQNQRANILALTLEGRLQAQRVQQAMEQAGMLAVAGLTDAECEQFAFLMQKMIDNLHKRCECS